MSINQIEKKRRELIAKGEKILNLSSGNPNEWGIFFDYSKLQNPLTKALSENIPYEPVTYGMLSARKSIQAYYNDKGIDVTIDQIALTSGSSESYFHLFRLLASGDGEVLLPKPGYPLFEEIARLSNTRIKYYELDESNNWQIKKENLEKNISNKIKIIVLVSPNNPTGTVLNEQSLKTVCDVAEKYGCCIISDEVFSEYFHSQRVFPSVIKMKTTVPIFTLSGISKTYALPGWKLGWIIMNNSVTDEQIDELERSLDSLLTTNQLSQILLPEIFQHGGDCIKKIETRLQENICFLQKKFGGNDRYKFVQCEGGFYTFMKIEGIPYDDETFVIECMEQTKIYVHPGYYYDYEDGLYIVISLLPPPHIFKESLEKISEFIKKVEVS